MIDAYMASYMAIQAIERATRDIKTELAALRERLDRIEKLLAKDI
jgi:predicted  nucleic acid-binding Zn-ribbon protein